jgi:hypothetical protein
LLLAVELLLRPGEGFSRVTRWDGRVVVGLQEPDKPDEVSAEGAGSVATRAVRSARMRAASNMDETGFIASTNGKVESGQQD